MHNISTKDTATQQVKAEIKTRPNKFHSSKGSKQCETIAKLKTTIPAKGLRPTMTEKTSCKNSW